MPESQALHKLSTNLSTLGAAVLSLFLLLGFIPGSYIFELAGFLRLPATLLLAALLTTMTALKARKRALVLLPVFILSAFSYFQLFLPHSIRAGQEDRAAQQRGAANTADMHNFTILTFNAEAKNNKDYLGLAEMLDRHSPDIVALQGLTKPWIAMMEHGLKGYPYNCQAIEEQGIALYSRLPIQTSEIHYFGHNRHPRLIATLNIAGRPIHVFVANPSGPKSQLDFEERNAELELILKELKACTGAKILAGDLNTAPWAANFNHLYEANIYDSAEGFGPQSSWPARGGRLIPHLFIPPVVPIDHVLLSEHFKVTERKAGPAIGSDHLPVIVKTQLLAH